MKILVVSDTHRKLENLKVILEREQPMDLLIHLGDAEGDEDSIAEMAGCRLEIVAGNNDFFSNLPREKELLHRQLSCIDHAWTLLLCQCGDRRY